MCDELLFDASYIFLGMPCSVLSFFFVVLLFVDYSNKFVGVLEMNKQQYSLFEMNGKEFPILFERTDVEKTKAFSSFSLGDEKCLVMYSSCLRELREEDKHEEKEYFGVLHKEEDLKNKQMKEYSLKDLVDDFQVNGVVVILSRGGYFQIAYFEKKSMCCTKHKGMRRYINRKGQGHRQSKHSNANGKKTGRSAG